MTPEVGKCYNITWSEDSELYGIPYVNKVRVVSIEALHVTIQDLERKLGIFETSISLYDWRELSELEKALL